MTKDRADNARHGPWILALALPLLAFAGWRAYTLAMANFWSGAAPERALALRAGFPKARFAQAERKYMAGGDLRGLQPAVRDALAKSPVDGRGFRYLGRAAEQAGESNAARQLYGLAVKRSPRDLASVAWLLGDQLKRGEYDGALQGLDRLMRASPENAHRLSTLIERLATVPEAQAPLARRLALLPPWRDAVLKRLLTRSSNVSAMFPFVELLRTTPRGLSPEELAGWVDNLARSGEWGSAYMVWVQSLSPEASQHIGNVYNGSFEREPGVGGFDWRFGQVAGAGISRAQTVGVKGDFALRVSFSEDRVPFKHVQQMLALPPGRFRLSGRVRLDDLRTDRGLAWSITCAGQRTALGTSEAFSGRRDWSDFGFEFEVPTEGCGGQWLALTLPARIEAEQRIGGVAWFDDLRIKPQ